MLRNEINQVSETILSFSPNYKPQILYTLVDKRINSRFTEKKGDDYQNPAPGTVIDTGLTEHAPTQSSFDFYMIAHRATIATALPVHYFVASNNTKMNK